MGYKTKKMGGEMREETLSLCVIQRGKIPSVYECRSHYVVDKSMNRLNEGAMRIRNDLSPRSMSRNHDHLDRIDYRIILSLISSACHNHCKPFSYEIIM